MAVANHGFQVSYTFHQGKEASIERFIQSLTPTARADLNQLWAYMRRHHSDELNQRIREYTYLPFSSASTSLTLFCLTTVTSAASTAAIGAGCAAAMMPQGLSKEAKKNGVLLGGGAGAIFGSLTGGYAYLKLMELSKDFQAWEKEQNLVQAMKEHLNQTYQNDVILREYVQNGVIVENCATVLAGHSYELHGHIDLFIAKRIRHCLTQERNNLRLTGNNPYGRAHLDKFLEGLDKKIATKYKEEKEKTGAILNSSSPNAIQQCRAQEDAFYIQCGQSPIHDPNWNDFIPAPQ